MPELPEVESFTRTMIRVAQGRKIASVKVLDERILGAITPARLRAALAGRTIGQIRRHGKHLFANAGGKWLHLHFGMSGELVGLAVEEPLTRFARVVLRFTDDTRLVFDDMRLFGVVELVDDPDAWLEEHGLGPDAMAPAFTLRSFRQALKGRRGAIKAQLMGQNLVAGLGNLYADESLWRSGIDPRRDAGTLSTDEVAVLYRAFRRVLAVQIRKQAAGADLPANSLLHHRQKGDRCPRCGGLIGRVVVGGRTTFFCTRHQR